MKKLLLISFCIGALNIVQAQDTFSIVAVDSVTGEVGSAGASCVDLFNFPGYSTDFLGELFPGVGAINTQAAYDPGNQVNARTRMNAGDSPTQIINWLAANDVGANPTTRQYGIVRLIAGSPKTAGYTGTNCMNYKNHIEGVNYCIQGNILLGQKVLDSMESRFIREKGDLACKLMAALQGANMVGADTRCSANGTSSLFAFVKVAKPTDAFGSPSFLLSVKTYDGARAEPVDSLQREFDKVHSCITTTGMEDAFSDRNTFTIYPNPADNIITIKLTENLSAGATTCIIKDVLGRKMLEEVLITEKTVNINKWENGIYFVEVMNGTTRVIKKVVKQ